MVSCTRNSPIWTIGSLLPRFHVASSCRDGIPIFFTRSINVERRLLLIMGPLLEEYSLLGLPDLFHELGHLIVDRERLRFLGRFDVELKNHFAKEKRRVRIAQ